MKTTLIRILCALCAALCLLPLAACGKKDEVAEGGTPGYIINQTNKDDPKTELTEFYKGNLGTLRTIAVNLGKNGKYAHYEYATRMTDYDSGTLEFYVTEERPSTLTTLWVECNDKMMLRLAKVKFVGSVLYDPEINRDVVLFTPSLATQSTTYALAYCPSAAGRAVLTESFYHKNSTVTISEIAENWYIVEAVRNG